MDVGYINLTLLLEVHMLAGIPLDLLVVSPSHRKLQE